MLCVIHSEMLVKDTELVDNLLFPGEHMLLTAGVGAGACGVQL